MHRLHDDDHGGIKQINFTVDGKLRAIGRPTHDGFFDWFDPDTGDRLREGTPPYEFLNEWYDARQTEEAGGDEIGLIYVLKPLEYEYED